MPRLQVWYLSAINASKKDSAPNCQLNWVICFVDNVSDAFGDDRQRRVALNPTINPWPSGPRVGQALQLQIETVTKNRVGIARQWRIGELGGQFDSTTRLHRDGGLYAA